MHQISEIEKLSSGRYYITLDDGLQFPLYGKEMGKYGIEVNEVLSEEAYLEIMLELLPARAKKKALHLLERMDRAAAADEADGRRISVGDRGTDTGVCQRISLYR